MPHVNAYAIAAGSGVVLFDTGMHEPGSFAQLERALAQAGLGIEHIRLVVCTHAHSDHYGQAASICERGRLRALDASRPRAHDQAGRRSRGGARAADRGRAPERRADGCARALPRGEPGPRAWHRRASSCPTASSSRESRSTPTSAAGRSIETPGHAPSHVVLHQPERRLLISGDHVLGRPSLFFDFGYTPDPVGEYLTSLEKVRALDVDLILAGHGRPARDLESHIDAHLDLVDGALDRIRAALADEPRTAFEIAGAGIGLERVPRAAMSWAMSLTLSYLRRMEVTGQVERVEGSDPERWRLV